MSIIDYTSRLKLTQYTGNSIMPQFMRNYNKDMAKIDAYFDEYEAGINQTISDMQTDIEQFEQRVDADFQSLSTEVGTYSERITTLESCCSDVNTVLSNYGSRLNAIELVIDTVSTQNIEDIIARVDALENKVNTNSTEIVTLQHDLGEAVDRIGDIEATIVTHATDITNLGNRVTTLENCCEEVRGTLAEYNTRIATNASDIDALEERLTRDETNIAGNSQDIIIVSQQTAVNTQDIQDLKDAFDTIDPQSALSVVRQVAINTENITNLQSSVSAQSTSISNLTTRVAGDEDTIANQGTRIGTLEDEFEQISDWQDAIDAATAAAQQATSDVAAMQTDVTAIESDITSIESDITALQAADTALGTRVTTLEGKEATVESNLSALDARVTANEGSITNIESTIHADEAGLASVTTRVTTLETQNGTVDISAVGNSITDAVDKVNTKVVNAASMATQALATANAVDAVVGDSSSGLVKDVADNASNISALETTVGDSSGGLVKDVADNASGVAQNASDISSLDSRVDALEDATKYVVGQEVKIGTYLGKDLFRRTIKGTLPNSTNADATLNSPFITGTTAVPMYERYIPTNNWSTTGKIYVTKFWGVARHQVNGNIQVGQVPIPVVFNDRQLINVWHWNIGNSGQITEQIMLRTAGYTNAEFVLNVEYTKEDTLLP